MNSADFLIIGGGVAGLSAAARLAEHGRVAVIEAETALGYHSSGRSVAFSHYGIGDAVVRGLTADSRSFFTNPPQGFCPTPLSRTSSILYFATEKMLPALDRLRQEIAPFTDRIVLADETSVAAICPVLRTGTEDIVRGIVDPSGLRLDADALLQSFAREIRAKGGEIALGQRSAAIARNGTDWAVRSEIGEEWSGPLLINAAGAWADKVAILAGVAPLGLAPKRRTIIVLDPPPGQDVRAWPFVISVERDFYMQSEAGRLLVSPVDEVDDEPGDAQPEEYDIALAALRLEQYTNISVSRIAHLWAGLRSFVRDRVPTAGFAPDAPGFFWLAGQGGYGLQTAPAMAAITEALITGAPWPERLTALGVTEDRIRPERLLASRSH